jgi:hypothetical protein
MAEIKDDYVTLYLPDFFLSRLHTVIFSESDILLFRPPNDSSTQKDSTFLTADKKKVMLQDWIK